MSRITVCILLCNCVRFVCLDKGADRLDNLTILFCPHGWNYFLVPYVKNMIYSFYDWLEILQFIIVFAFDNTSYGNKIISVIKKMEKKKKKKKKLAPSRI